MKKYVVYREVTAIYGTIVEADSEEDAYELVDDENNKTDSENPERKWIIDMADDVESWQMEAIDDTLNFEFDRDFTMNTNTNKGMKQ